MEWRNKRVLVVGLGVLGGGVATIKWLANQGCRLTVTDLKNRRQLAKSLQSLRDLPIKFVLGGHPLSLLKNIDIVVQNPAVPNDSGIIKQALKKKKPIASEASIFFEFCPAPIIGVTGTKGKSTVATLIGHIFKAMQKSTVVAGNIKDKLMLTVLPQVRRSTVVVLELSSWQLEGLARFKTSPHVGVITNILPDHMDRYKNLSTYAGAKANIFTWQKKNDLVILNYDNADIRRLARRAKGKIYWFSLKKKLNVGSFVQHQAVWFSNGKTALKLLNLSDIKLPGEHNVANVLAAASVAAACGVKGSVIKKAVSEFRGLHSRQELVKKQNGIVYINDTTATMPLATQNALLSFKNKKITLIAGGHDKNLDYKSLANEIRKRVSNLILFPGTATKKIITALPQNYEFLVVKNMRLAVAKARQVTPVGGVVLMSPGAASFGTFINEWDRGSQFVKAVKAIK